jgi:hypothetical protein
MCCNILTALSPQTERAVNDADEDSSTARAQPVMRPGMQIKILEAPTLTGTGLAPCKSEVECY